MEKKTDKELPKGLLNEVLPDPDHARQGGPGSPRERTSSHLKKLMAAAAGIAMNLPSASFGDATIPTDGDKNKGTKPPADAAKPPPPQPPPYGVVDPLPRPYHPKPGFLNLTTNPDGLPMIVDGEDTGEKTPLKNRQLDAGHHTIELPPTSINFGKVIEVDIASGKTVTQTIDLRKVPAKKKIK